MPVLERSALLLLMLAALLAAGQGILHLQTVLGGTSGEGLWLPVAKLVGGAAVAFWGWRQLRRLGRERAEAQEQHASRPGLRFQADTDPMLQAYVLTGCLGVAVLMLFGPDLDTRYQGILGVLMLALTVYLALLTMTGQPDDTPALGMDATGLEHMWFGRVPWDQVHGIELEWQVAMVRHRRRFRIPVLVLGVSDPDRYLGRAPVAARMTQDQVIATGASHGEIRIPLAALDARPARVALVAKGLRAAVLPKLLAGWRAGMSAGDVRRLVSEAGRQAVGGNSE